MGWKLSFAAVAVGIVAIAGPAWIVSHPAPPAPPPAPVALSAPLIASLQAEADNACRCSRANGTEDGIAGCWASFNRDVAPYQQGTMASPCTPVDYSAVCLDANCEASITVDRTPKGWCTNEERRIAEAVWEHALSGESSEPAYARASRALKSLNDAFRRGEKVSAPKSRGSDSGC